jgi:aminoglycoside/choline kinase family phosphotransferase
MNGFTPAQIQFLARWLSGFEPSAWIVSEAGYAGSERRFLRIRKTSGEKISYIIVLWDSRDSDWNRFITIERELRGIVPFLPEVFASDEVHGLILEEDLGDATLKSIVAENPGAMETTYRRAIDALVQWQGIALTTSSIIASRSMDLEVFLWESRYFAVHCVTEFFGNDGLLSKEWEKERTEIALAAAAFPKVYIHRDFQSENILMHDDSIRFVDFQGARLGPAGYDLASLLFDPYITQLDDGLCGRLFEYYREKTRDPLDEDSFHICALQRLMQALGAYGNLSIHKGKERYRQFIPLALDRCHKILGRISRFPHLTEIVNACRAAK